VTTRRSQSLFQSFNFAAEGIIHAVRTQRNLWIHFAVAVAVLVAAIGFGASKLELAVLLLAITFVLVAELVNTAVEAVVDVASTSFDPIAKIAKDIAAGAVLVAALNAIAVGYLVFSGEVATRSSRFLTRLSDAPAELTLVALAVTVILVIAVKAYTGRGTPLRGGLPSGHAAVAFAGWMAIALPRLLRDLHHGLARGTDPRRDRCALRLGGGQRCRARRARDPAPLPGVRMSASVPTDDELLAAADAAATRAYAPYSHFHVGCVVLARDGRLIEGVNVENAAYPLGVCAERTAFSRAVSEGYRPGDFAVAAITASPCGGCRQWLHEMGVDRVVFRNGGRVVTMTTDELLPESFDSTGLE
jgi:homotetrameric cytidine deaminase